MIKKLMALFQKQTNEDLMAKIEFESQGRARRNEARMKQIKEEMGEKWIMHPSHTKTKLEEPRPV